MPPSLDDAAGARFELVSRLGEGAMGVVFAAIDRERGSRVALKVLRTLGGEALTRFKREFRALQDLHHPNLLQLHELVQEGGRWFFTMELVDGLHFLDWLRDGGDGEHPDEARLREAFGQLAAGLVALHEAGKIHRDVKPSNIMVTRDGRVVVMDFGLIADLQGEERSLERQIVGTAAYMSPEQASSRAVTPAADWYAFGTLLYEALTGRVPFEGLPLEVLMRKQETAPTPPSTHWPAVPRSLEQLCLELLRTDPEARPSGAQVIERLGAKPARSASERTPLPAPLPATVTNLAGAPFIGRRKELAFLREARAAVREGHPVTVHLLGDSGVGKSALAQAFAAEVRAGEPTTVVLTARCFERESASFKAADGIIEALSRHLAQLPSGDVVQLLPLKIGLLAQMFPSLLRVDAVARAPLVSQFVKDPLELRQRLFAAFRELLAQVAAQRPLLVIIDDLHWADADSLALLAAVLRPPGAPGAMVLATSRQLPAAAAALAGDVRELAVDVLPPEQAVDLATLLLERAGGARGADPAELAREAGGQPMYIDELVRHVAATGASATGSRRLEDAIWARVQGLEPPARRLLELCAVAGGPISQQIAAAAADLSHEELARVLALLRASNLVRTSGARAHDSVEPYHGRVREVVLAYLDEAAGPDLHRRLAVALEAVEPDADEALAAHWSGAGQPERAAMHAERAAERAAKALAFDLAARMCLMALSLGEQDDRGRLRLWRRLGEALANAGRGKDASAAFLDAAALARPEEALALRRRAADQLLRSGFIDEGTAVVREVLAAAGLALPDTPRRALVGMLARRARIRLRGLRFRERDESQIPQAQLARIDVCWSIAQGLALVDFVRSADFQTRHLLLALQAGEPYRISRAIATEAGQLAVGGAAKTSRRTTRLLDEARALAERTAHPHALGLVDAMAGVTAFLYGRFREAQKRLDAAETVLRERCVDVNWEVTSCQLFSFWSTTMLGDMNECGRRQARLRREYQERGDRLGETNIVLGLSELVLLARDATETAKRHAAEALSRWSHTGFQLQHAYDAYAGVMRDIYDGDAGAAARRIDTAWPMLAESLLMQVQVIRCQLREARARAYIAAATAASAGTAFTSKHWLTRAEKDARAILGEKVGWCAPVAELLLAGIAAARRDGAQARERLERAVTGAEQAELALVAASARRRLGELIGGAEGEAAIARADEQLVALGVKRPARLATTFVPGPFGAAG